MLLLDTIGNTPLVRLKMSENLPGQVLVKLENKNPGGSIKDRVAKHLLLKAVETGLVNQNTPIIEATSG